MCLCVRDRERRWGERRDTAASDRRCGNVRGKETMRSVREEFSRRESAEMTWMMDESSTLLHRRKEKSVCCVCVRCLRDREAGERIEHRYSGALRTQKVRRGPERVVAEEYGVLKRAKAGAGRYKRQRKESDRAMNHR